MKKLIVICLMLLVISLIGCAKKEAPPGPTSTEASVNDIGNGISDAGATDKDLSTSDLDNLNSDLDNINW